ncbi:MAG: ATP-binding protein [Lachnospiraceae bacterium]|nr:ATP-binding protein [Lachnospiraceae bacterium]MDE7203596.1 ATP-binding protein [Lachnospiraceae bacterium]
MSVPSCLDFLRKNSLPKTTKQDIQNHGYVLRSIQEIVKNYGGNIELNGRMTGFACSVSWWRLIMKCYNNKFDNTTTQCYDC